MKAPLPPDEDLRLTVLRQYDVLDTPAEPAFDDLALLAAHICQTPIALISLLDEKRQWFKARLGISAAETSRDAAFCAHAILDKGAVLEVPDATKDRRFADNPLVQSDPRIVFYAGAPLVTPAGQPLGTLCVIDHIPRALTVDQLAALRCLSRQVISQLELRRQARELAVESAERRRGETLLKAQIEQLTGNKLEADRMLAVAQRSRQTLLSVLEDEKLAGKNLRESEERFRLLAENINEVFWITNPTMTEMIYVSPAYEKIWGRTCASLHESPRDWLEAIHPEDRHQVEQAAARMLQSGSYDATFRILRPDQTERWIHDQGFLVHDEQGTIYRIVGTAEDITEKRKLEEQFRQAQKMESIGQLAGGIAHDFNNILSAIIGHAYLIKQDAAGNTAILSSLGAISSAANRATDLVRQILTFSRLGRQERELVELNEIVLEALKLLRASVPTTIRIQTELDPTPPVLANATAIHQLIMNLGTNAWHAMGDQPGTLKVALTGLAVAPEFAQTHPDLHPGHYVRLLVSDTGIGMDQATLSRIFEPFFTTKGIGEGTGLGLAVVHGIMKNHEGAIIVHSRPGEGTEFQLYFPAVAAEVGPGETNAVPIIPGRGEHVLFVDDEESLTSVAERLLEGQGYLVTTKNCPFEARDALRAEPAAFDLVIIDLTMPGMDGAKLGGELLKIRPQLPIILTSGYSRTLTNEKARDLGFLGLLQKPCTPEALIEAVYRAVHQK